MADNADNAGNASIVDRDTSWRIVAPLLVIVAGVCWGIIALFSETLADAGLEPIQITVVRCVIATVCFGGYLLVRNRAALRIRLKDIWMFLGTGVASIALFNVCYFGCIRECNVSLACILLYTAPCFVTIMARIFFKEALGVRKLVALAMAFGGCLLVVGVGAGDSALSTWGIVLGLGSGIGYALYSIFGRVALERYGTITVTFYTFLIAALALLPFSDPAEILGYATGALGGKGADGSQALFVSAVMIGLGVIATVVPFACYTTGLQHMETSKASIMAFVEPMVALLVGVLAFHDVLTPSNILGIVLIVAAVLLLNLQPRK